ncbi:hypothetical protein BDV29DRAFT_168745 [Aspergillus leporis]|uniref:Ankyrin repeat-containing domain protein n=1 Tax=Aspergillus leporis TaxID=41062 RepID=A0A5N5X8U6_9EURO|nr:hypothetical protein BDV29DRAFT_168745 [Aspergillus leporis]
MAIDEGLVSAVKLLLENGVELNVKNGRASNRQSFLLQAIEKGKLAIVKLLPKHAWR